jgi:hypothetical protein
LAQGSTSSSTTGGDQRTDAGGSTAAGGGKSRGATGTAARDPRPEAGMERGSGCGSGGGLLRHGSTMSPC